MVFTDLSGFTAMSERLGRKGRTGTEELVLHLDSIFDDLLGVAAQRGGSMLKFGGDALLIFFWGERHTRRAVAAASDMRARLRRVGAISTSVGKMNLRMSIGIHSGSFDFFLLGHAHADLVVAGPAATRCMEMETAAEAGQILVSADTAAGLPASATSPGPAGGSLLARRPSGVVLDDPPPVPAIEATRFVPVALRSYLGTGRPEQEHRQAAVGFVHVCGLDAPLAAGEQADVGARLQQLMADVETIFDEQGVTLAGTDAYDDGFKLVVTSGVPRAWDNNEERLLRAMRRLLDAGHGVDLRIGVHRGYVFAGDVGASFRRSYTVMGDPVNTAARVMSKARPGQLLATRDVLDRSRSQFALEELAPFSAKGKAKPLVAFLVGALIGTAHAPRADGLPFVGRGAELMALGQALGSALAGSGSALQIVAERGLGKSRLVAEALALVPALVAHRGQGDPYSMATAYAGLAPMVRSALGVADDPTPSGLARRVGQCRPDLLPWVPLVAVAAGIPDVPSTAEVAALDGSAATARAEQVTLDLLSATTGPAALVVDDADRLDQASRSLLVALAARAEEEPWVVIALSRVPVLEGASRMELGPLSHAEALSLVRRGTVELLPVDAERFVERAEGNPLFLTELLSHAGAATIPDSIEAAVRSRIDELEPAVRTVIQRAAVLGRAFDADLARQVLGHELDPVAAGVEAMVERAGPELRFRQALYQEVAYESLSFRRRRELHAEVGHALEQLGGDDAVDKLSLHFAAAGDWDRAWHYSKVAGDRARDRFSPQDARTLYLRALEAAERLRQQVAIEDVNSVRYELALADVYAGHHDEARAQLVRARRREQDAMTRANYLYLEAQADWLAGEYRQALSLLSRGLRLAPAEAAGLRSRMLCVAAKIRTTQGRLHLAVEAATRSAEEAEAAGDEAALAHAHVALFSALTGLGRHAEAEAYRQTPLRVFEERRALWQLASLQVIVGIAEYEQGRWRTAEDWYSVAIETATAAGDVNQLAMAENNRAEIYLDQGRLGEARGGFEAALGIWRPARFRVGVAVASANLGRIHGRENDKDQALAALGSAADELAALGVHDYAALARAWLAEVKVLNGEAAPDLDAVRAQEARAERTLGSLRLLAMVDRLRAFVAHRAADAPGAERALRSSLEMARQAGSRYEEALTLRARAEFGVGDPGDADAASAVLGELGVVWVPAVLSAGTASTPRPT